MNGYLVSPLLVDVPIRRWGWRGLYMYSAAPLGFKHHQGTACTYSSRHRRAWARATSSKEGLKSCTLLPLWGSWSHWCRAAKWLAEKKRYIVNNWLRMPAQFKLTIRLRTFTPDGKGQLTRALWWLLRQQTKHYWSSSSGHQDLY
jgi:hypothetical protein